MSEAITSVGAFAAETSIALPVSLAGPELLLVLAMTMVGAAITSLVTFAVHFSVPVAASSAMTPPSSVPSRSPKSILQTDEPERSCHESPR
nr:hypothetical protein [uncultured Caulobacter sp.]